eukprot:scaffold1008_cov174-Amphora_coffeaeformis.AAC.10
MRNLPLAVLQLVQVCVASLDLVARGSHGELVDSRIQRPIVTLEDLALFQDTLRLFLQKKIDKVGANTIVVGTGRVRDGWQENRVLGIALGNSVGVQSSKGI